ncbi:MAG: two-component regulator propeller domain-containing protein [Chitinophagaceae bacterium]
MAFIHHIKHPGKWLLLLIASGFWQFAHAQPRSFNLRQLSSSNGLSEPTIRCITQDRFGYIWIGTASGLNRFNGYEVKVFRHQSGDSNSLHENRVFALLTDSAGIIWLAQPEGISRYDYKTRQFSYRPGSKGITAYKMLQANNNEIYLATRQGLVLFDIIKDSFTWLKKTAAGESATLLGRYVNDFCYTNGNIYLATDSGLVRYNIATRRAETVAMPELLHMPIERIAADHHGGLRITYGEDGLRFMKTNERFQEYIVCDEFTLPKTSKPDNRITSIFCDNKGRTWLSTSQFGLCLYNDGDNKFAYYKHDPLQVQSISDNLTNMVFQDRQGYLWVGTEVSGVNYFEPDKAFFRVIQPSYTQSTSLPDYWCRAAAEDKNGDLWLGTAKGVAQYNLVSGTFKLFQHTTGNTNALWFNSVRSLLCDDDVVWIGTGDGVNRYHLRSGKMDFLGEKEKLPSSFYWSIIKDYKGNVWFACRDGIYRYNREDGSFQNFTAHPRLAPYAAEATIAIYEDSRHRLWFGFGAKGLMMYDPEKESTTHWQKNELDPSSLSDDHIISITEDKKGVMWIATTDGLNAYQERSNTFTRLLQGQGVISCLIADDDNRLWIASSKGLLMLDTTRKIFSSFDMNNGLPTVDFNYQSSFRTKSGDFVFPTLKGFVLFNPAEYVNKNKISETYIASFTIYGERPDTLYNFETKQAISLKANESFFSIEMIALNYGNPTEVWYAHKLEPFDKEWLYSKDRTVNYTNVPGGEYTFHYKTSTDMAKWSTNEKSLKISLATVYYKTWWFRLMILLLAAGVLLLLYKYRITQQEKVFSLQSKANSLEKEKVLVMYESLKQQLNPHFLFNSLTSLSGLITANPVNAKQFLDKMSKIYRYILTNRDHETVSLAEDLKLAAIYTELQQTRFADGLKVLTDVPENYLHRKIAPVTIQNLIENAIKHNIIDEGRPLLVNIFVEDNQLIVQNNLQKKKFVETSNKQGLVNMQSLYNYLSGRPVIIVEDAQMFTVKVPLL